MSKNDYGEVNQDFTNEMELQYIWCYADENNIKQTIEMANYSNYSDCNLDSYEEFLNSPELDKLFEAHQSYININ